MDMYSEEMPIVANAMEMLARASSTSEVLTLNLTNLLILLVLKALIFGFGLFSTGAAGRSSDESLMTPADMTGGMCFMMYMSGADEKLSCIERTACEDPYLAKDYLTAAKMIYKGYKLVGMHVGDKYASVMHSVNEAAEYGVSGKDCGLKYHW